MASDRNIQVSFLEWIKENSNSPKSFADDLAELLSISKDSAYRRIRGETLLSFEEIRKLSKHFKISVDNFMDLNTDSVLFNRRTINNDSFTFKDYLSSINDNLQTINQFSEKKLIYAAKDIPLFHFCQFQALNSFKSYFWLRTILNSPDHQQDTYHPDHVDPEIATIASSIWQKYLITPSIEIWSDETVNVTLRQIEFYFESGFLTKEQMKPIVDDFSDMINLIKLEALLGKKILVGNEDSGINNSYQLYYNEISISDNTIFFSMDGFKMVYKPFNMLNIMNTADESFCKDTEKYLNNIINKSIPISVGSEKIRNHFFNGIEEKVNHLIHKTELK